jgi:hypothetical protein
MNPIAEAIAPQKNEACERAAASVRARMNSIAATLVGTDLNITAPMPNGNMSRKDYLQARAFYGIARQVCMTVREGHSMRAPVMAVAVNVDGIARVANDAYEATAASFDAYVAKLVSKVGDCDEAIVDGSLWDHSILTVAKGAAIERWKTQQIINVSVLGNLFNQWPTRLVK